MSCSPPQAGISRLRRVLALDPVSPEGFQTIIRFKVQWYGVLAAAGLLLLSSGRADVRNCVCDVSRPETLEARECSLCKEAEKQPADVQFFFLRDTNPNKPNRWLLLPRFHGNRPQQLQDMTAEQRAAYWNTAIAKGRELWGEDWAIALNSTEKRTQCHLHIHIGK